MALSPNPLNKPMLVAAGIEDLIAEQIAGLSGSPRLPTIIASGGNNPIGSATAAGNQYMSSVLLYAPYGCRSLELFFAGFRVASNAETDLTGASQVRVRVGVRPMPWKPGKAYQVGDRVIWSPVSPGVVAGSIFEAVEANINSMPIPSNAKWTVVAPAIYQQATLNGQIACGSKTVTNISGTTVTEGFWKTDPMAILGADDECMLDVRTWVKDGGGIALGVGSGYSSGGFFVSGATTPDISGGSNPTSVYNVGGSALVRPSLARGIPAVANAKKSVLLIGDSNGFGTCAEQSSNSGATIVSGGSGYTSADIGKLVAINNAGGSASACAIPVILIITNVSGGAVNQVRTFHGGAYANSGTPTGTQGTVDIDADLAEVLGVVENPVSGSGLTCTLSFSSGGFDHDPATTAMGYVQRGLSNTKTLWSASVSPGDTLQGWNTRLFGRLGIIGQGNFDAVLMQLGINDVTNGRTFDQMKANSVTLYRCFRGLGIKHISQMTLPPFPSSTDGFATLNNQSVNSGQDAVRQAFNTWVRNGADGLIDAVLDVAAVTEDGGHLAPTGKITVNGTIGYATIDGKHFSPRILSLMAASVADHAEEFF